jgi:FkbM family methyltransferase
MISAPLSVHLTFWLGRDWENGRVYAFEALPANLERLRTNLALNGLQDRVQVVEAAVADCSKPVQFLVGPSGGMGKAAGSAGRQVEYSQSTRVPGLALDDFVYVQGNPPPQVVKMDIEGGEVLALPGMRRLLKEAHPFILLELHGPEAARIAWAELSEAGYAICQMEAGYPAVPSLDALGWKAYIVAKADLDTDFH